MAEALPGVRNFCWAKNSDLVWIPARVAGSLNFPAVQRVQVEPLDESEPYEILSSDIIPATEAEILNYTDDLTRLERLHEASILDQLRKRYAKDEIYTWIGKNVLISINPYKQLTIFSSAYISMFSNDLEASNQTSKSAHIFALAAAGIKQIKSAVSPGSNNVENFSVHLNKNQAFLISGKCSI